MAMTKLQAVNAMLAAIKEERFSALGSSGSWPSITYPGTIDGAAEFLLDNVSREVQSRGWKFNTVRCKKHTLGSSGAITFGSTLLRAEPSGPTQFRNYAVRTGAAYDLEGDTATFAAGDYFFDEVFEVEFSTAPEDIKQLILEEATRRFQQQRRGNPEYDMQIAEHRNVAEVHADRAKKGKDITANNAQPVLTKGPQGGQ